VVAYVKTELITVNVATEIYKTKVSEALTTKPKEAELLTCQQPTLRQIRERAETKNATKLLTFNYNNMKTILDKINKAYEIQANKTELGKHEVELAVADNLKKALKVYIDSVSKYGKELDNAFVPIRTLEKAITELKGNVQYVTSIAQELRKSEDNVSNELDLVRKKIQEAKQELGITIDINDVVDLGSLQNSNKISSGIQKDAADYVKYVNSLQAPKI
jgi:hypothetical protein